MNERDLAEALILANGQNALEEYSFDIPRACERHGLDPARVHQLMVLAKVKVTWDE